jgi:hypothetical protein
LHHCQHREIPKIWKERRKYRQEGQGRDRDRKKRGGLKTESGRMSSIKDTTIIITMIIKEESRDTKKLIIITISIKGESMTIGRIKTCSIDRDKERNNISIKIGTY